MKKISQAELMFTPDDAGYCPDRVDFLDDFLLKLIEEKKLQCASYAMSKDNKLFACKGMGRLRYDEGDDNPCLYNSIRRIASVTKLITAAAIMKLVEDGVLETGSPVATYIKEFKTNIHEDITLAHLLTHTSGIFSGEGIDEPYPYPWWDICAQQDSKYNWIEAALTRPLRADPGKEWIYSSFGYAVLGEIITRETGTKAEEWIMNNIIKPLGMEDTYFDVPKEKWDRVIAADDWSDPYKREENRAKYLEELKSKGKKELDIPNTGGGLHSTPSDLIKFGEMLVNCGIYNGVRILHRKTVELMRMDFANGAKNYCWGAKGKIRHYGLGPQLYGLNKEGIFSLSAYGHEGAGRSAIYIDPDERFVAVNFVPTTEAWLPKTVYNLRNIMWSGII